MEQKIKQGDIVRLTDPISNGEVVRVEKVDEHGYMDFIGGSQHITTAKQIMISPYLNTNSNTISETCHEIARNTGVKLYPESAVNYWKHRAEVAEQSNALNEKLLKDEHNKLLDAQDEIEKIKDKNIEDEKELRAVFFRQNKILVEQNKALEDRRKELEETADELDKELCKTQKERDELRERIKHLEADLDEGGFNDLKKDILTLVNLISCNDGNESVINDIKNLLK